METVADVVEVSRRAYEPEKSPSAMSTWHPLLILTAAPFAPVEAIVPPFTVRLALMKAEMP